MVNFYAVARGNNTGVFLTWAECEAQIKGVKGAVFKKFSTKQEAEKFVSKGGGHAGGRAPYTLTPSQEAARASPAPPAAAPSPSSHSLQQRTPSPPATTNMNHVVRQLHSLQGKVGAIRASISSFMEEKNRELSELGEEIGGMLVKVETPDGGEITVGGGMKRKSDDPPTPTVAATGKKTKYLDFDHIPCVDSASLPLTMGPRGFIEDDQGWVHVYTDGACEGNGYKHAKAGIGVWFGPDHMHNISKPVTAGARATNNVAEIQAATAAVNRAFATNISRLQVNTDSMFMINSMTKWLPAWKRNGWKTSTQAPVQNRTEFEDLEEAMNKNPNFELKWNHVRGHRGIVGNEGADVLAKAGAKLFVPAPDAQGYEKKK